jgi:leukotriene-A4 hydrolase
MFSQCEDINCRSLAPLQDTPSVKATYGACVTTENPLVPYMSANISSVVPVASTNNTITCFHMDIPIASYLIAISIGNIQY